MIWPFTYRDRYHDEVRYQIRLALKLRAAQHPPNLMELNEITTELERRITALPDRTLEAATKKGGDIL